MIPRSIAESIAPLLIPYSLYNVVGFSEVVADPVKVEGEQTSVKEGPCGY